MTTILLIIQILVAIALVAVVLMQRSEGGALGIGGGGPGGMMSGRSAANLLTRTTMILGAVFMANSIALAALSTIDRSGQSVIDRLGTQEERGPLPFDFDDEGDAAPADEAPATEAPEEPAEVPAPFEGEAEDAPVATDDEPGR
jgi:preprotein translocase subunit SecG